MRVLVINHFTEDTEAFEGTHEQVERRLLDAYPWLQVPGVAQDVMETLEHLDATAGYQVEVDGLQEPLVIEPSNLFDGPGASDSEVVQDMLGFQPAFTAAFSAARFLAGGGEIPFERMRQALWHHEDDLDAAALAAYGFDVTDQNRAALRAVGALDVVKKAEPATPTAREVYSPVASGEDVAHAVARAFADQFVFPVKLGGKHSKGSLLARDEAEHQTWLLKPGSGGPSPAAGAAEDPSTQSAREAAFFQVAKEWDLDRWFPRAELLVIDDREFAAMALLPWSFKTMEKRKVKEPAIARRTLQRFLQDGTLHRWAVLDYVLGNPDRHGQNVMVDDDGSVKLIDHGSAFAGNHFDPANDQDSFVPAYLRAWAVPNFNALTPEQKLQSMPRLNEKEATSLLGWVNSLDGAKLGVILQRYGINPQPAQARLERMKQASLLTPADAAINQLWVTT